MNNNKTDKRIKRHQISDSAVEIFVFSAGILFLCTALAKLISATGTARVLQLHDPVFLVSFRTLFWLVGTIELVVAGVCLFGRNLFLQMISVAWLATSFLIYRLAVLWIGYEKPCPCLGNLTSSLHLSSQTAESVLTKILAYLFIGSYATLFWLWRQRNTDEGSKSLKVAATITTASKSQ